MIRPPPPPPPPASTVVPPRYAYSSTPVALGAFVRPPLPPPVMGVTSRPEAVAGGPPENRLAVGGPPVRAAIASVYVGCIPTDVSDEQMKSILNACGDIVKWCRSEDPMTQKPSAFGFCEFENFDGVYRACHYLGRVIWRDVPLKISSQDKVKAAADEWKKNLITDRINHYRLEGTTLDVAWKQSAADFVASEFDRRERVRILAEEIGKAIGAAAPSLVGDLDEGDAREDSRRGAAARRVRPKAAIARPQSSSPLAYLSLEYVASYKERQREQRWLDFWRIRQRELGRRERDWDRTEGPLRRGLTRDARLFERRFEDWPQSPLIFLGPDGGRESMRFIELDRSGVRFWESTSDADEARRVRKQRKRHRAREKELDDEDRLTEVRELEDYEKWKIEHRRRQSPAPLPLPPSDEDSAAEPTDEMPEDLAKQPTRFALQSGGMRTDEPVDESDGDRPNVFGLKEEEEEAEFSRKHRPLTKLDSALDPINRLHQAQEAEQRKSRLLKLAAKVPTERTEIFEFPLDWAHLSEASVIESKLRPWIVKKVAVFVGTEEPEIVEFIISKFEDNCPKPLDIVESVGLFLDVEADGFVVRLWKMLIFEQLRLEEAL